MNEVLEKLLSIAREEKTLKSFKEKAWKRFLSCYAEKDLFKEKSSDAVQQKTFQIDSNLTFVDGKFCKEKSNVPKDIVAMPLQQAMTSYGLLLKNRWTQSLEEEKNPFALLNHALFCQGLFLYVPPQMVLENPLTISHYITKPATLLSPRIEGFIGREAKAQCIYRTYCQENAWSNPYVEMHLEEGSNLTWITLSDGYTDTFRARLKRDSTINIFSLLFGCQKTEHDIEVRLLGENSSAHLKGCWLLDKKRKLKTKATVKHLSPHTHSSQHYKGIVKDASRSHFEGNIHIDPIAQKTEAYQLCNNLIIGDHALCKNEPNLHILADDVKATHGSTTTHFSEEEIFYLKTRGIKDEISKEFLMKGFLREILDQMPRGIDYAI